MKWTMILKLPTWHSVCSHSVLTRIVALIYRWHLRIIGIFTAKVKYLPCFINHRRSITVFFCDGIFNNEVPLFYSREKMVFTFKWTSIFTLGSDLCILLKLFQVQIHLVLICFDLFSLFKLNSDHTAVHILYYILLTCRCVLRILNNPLESGSKPVVPSIVRKRKCLILELSLNESAFANKHSNNGYKSTVIDSANICSLNMHLISRSIQTQIFVLQSHLFIDSIPLDYFS